MLTWTDAATSNLTLPASVSSALLSVLLGSLSPALCRVLPPCLRSFYR